MTINKTFVFFLLVIIYWFLCGGPNFVAYPTSLGLYALGMAYLTLILWNDKLFHFFSGDAFTYGALGMGVALSFGLPGMAITSLLVRVDTNLVVIPEWLGKIGVGILLLGLLVIASVPIVTTNQVGVLPLKENRRWFDDETTTSEDLTDV